MNCDPEELASLSRCYCLGGHWRRAWIYALCQWANNLTPPVPPVFSWAPASSVGYWEDALNPGGTTGDLATFYATADNDTVRIVQLVGVGITDILNCSSLPLLDELVCPFNPITNLDLSGCALLYTLVCSSSNLSSITVAGCVSLHEIDCHLTSISDLDISDCPAIALVLCRLCSLTTSVVNSILIHLDNSGINGGSCELESQAPAAPPSGLGIVAKTSLLSVPRGPWTVTTD